MPVGKSPIRVHARVWRLEVRKWRRCSYPLAFSSVLIWGFCKNYGFIVSWNVNSMSILLCNLCIFMYCFIFQPSAARFPGCWRSALVETVFSWSTSLVWISWTPSLVAYCLAGQQCLSIHRYPLKRPAFKSLQPSKQIAVRRPNFLMFNRSNWATVLCIKMHISHHHSCLPSQFESHVRWKTLEGESVIKCEHDSFRSCVESFCLLHLAPLSTGGCLDQHQLQILVVDRCFYQCWLAWNLLEGDEQLESSVHKSMKDSAGICEVFFGTNCFFLISSWLLPCFSAFCTVLGFIYFLALCFCAFLLLFFLFFFVGLFFGFFSAC